MSKHWKILATAFASEVIASEIADARGLRHELESSTASQPSITAINAEISALYETVGKDILTQAAAFIENNPRERERYAPKESRYRYVGQVLDAVRYKDSNATAADVAVVLDSFINPRAVNKVMYEKYSQAANKTAQDNTPPSDLPSVKDGETLPEEFSVQVNPASDQGSCGNCWANTVVAVIESALHHQTKGTSDQPLVELSIPEVTSCTRAFLIRIRDQNMDGFSNGCNGGLQSLTLMAMKQNDFRLRYQMQLSEVPSLEPTVLDTKASTLKTQARTMYSIYPVAPNEFSIGGVQRGPSVTGQGGNCVLMPVPLGNANHGWANMGSKQDNGFAVKGSDIKQVYQVGIAAETGGGERWEAVGKKGGEGPMMKALKEFGALSISLYAGSDTNPILSSWDWKNFPVLTKAKELCVKDAEMKSDAELNAFQLFVRAAAYPPGGWYAVSADVFPTCAPLIGPDNPNSVCECSRLHGMSRVYCRARFACQEIMNHAVTLVGWGQCDTEYCSKDGKKLDTPLKYWTIRNSWGSGWGEDGYFKVERGTNTLGTEWDVQAIRLNTDAFAAPSS